MKNVAILEQKQFERLDRHVRTSATVRELAYWNSVRIESALPARHDKQLRDAIDARLATLTGGKR